MLLGLKQKGLTLLLVEEKSRSLGESATFVHQERGRAVAIRKMEELSTTS